MIREGIILTIIVVAIILSESLISEDRHPLTLFHTQDFKTGKVDTYPPVSAASAQEEFVNNLGGNPSLVDRCEGQELSLADQSTPHFYSTSYLRKQYVNLTVFGLYLVLEPGVTIFGSAYFLFWFVRQATGRTEREVKERDSCTAPLCGRASLCEHRSLLKVIEYLSPYFCLKAQVQDLTVSDHNTQGLNDCSYQFLKHRSPRESASSHFVSAEVASSHFVSATNSTGLTNRLTGVVSRREAASSPPIIFEF